MRRVLQSLAVAGWAAAILAWGAGAFLLEYIIGNQPLEPIGEYSVPVLVEGVKHYATQDQQFYDLLTRYIFFWGVIFSALCTVLYYALTKIRKGPPLNSKGATEG